MCSLLLSEEQVNSLLHGLSDGEGEINLPCNGVIPFSFYENTDRIIIGRFPVLESINDIIGQKASKCLSECFEIDIEVNPISINMSKYREFVRQLTIPMSIYIDHSNTLNSSILNIMDLRFTYNLIEMGLGGNNLESKQKTLYKTSDTLTPCGDNIMDEVHRLILECQNETWKRVFDLDLVHKEKVCKHQYNLNCSATELVIEITFEVTVHDRVGTFITCIPYSMLEPIYSLLKDGQFSEECMYRNMKPLDKNIINSIKSDVIFYKKMSTINLKELCALEVDDIILFNDNNIEGTILNKVKFHGTLEENKVCITDILGKNTDKVNIDLVHDCKPVKKAFLSKFLEYIDLLYSSYSNSKKLKYFDFFKKFNPKLTVYYLEKEHPQLIATVIHHLKQNKNKVYLKVLEQLSPELKEDVLKRVDNMKNTSKYITRIVHNTLKAEMKEFKFKKYNEDEKNGK